MSLSQRMTLRHHRAPRVVFWLVLFATVWLLGLVKVSAQEFLAPEKAFAMQAQMVSPTEVAVSFDIAPGYYMYRDRFELSASPGDIELTQPVLPPGEIKYDPTFDKDMALFFDEVEFVVSLPVETDSTQSAPINLTVISQGCADAGICYPPMTSAIVVKQSGDAYRIIHQQPIVDQDRPLPSDLERLATVDNNPTGSTPSEEGFQWRAMLDSGDDRGFAGALSTAAMWQVILLFFLLGLLLAFTPCVLPMVPILSALIIGQKRVVSRGRGLALAAAYVFGMSIIYTVLGVLAGLSGVGLAAALQTPWVLMIFALLLAIFGLAMFDVIRVQMPTAMQTRLSDTASSLKGGRLWAAFVMGALSALIVGPCVAAPLAGALLYISQSGDVVLGGSVLFAMAWGMGLPLLLMGASAGSLLPKAGVWMEGVKAFFGMLLFATAWWMLNPVLPAWLEIAGWAVLAGLSAVLLGAFDCNSGRSSLGAAVRKTLGLLLALLAIVWLVGLLSGGRSLFQPLDHLSRVSGDIGTEQTAMVASKPAFERVRSVAELEQRLAGSTQPVMLDFYADWCVSCKEMEQFTFTDPQVIERMQQMLLLKADVTANNRDDRALLKRFSLFGPPGIIFFKPGGEELKQIRVVGFQNADNFVDTLDQALIRQ